MSSIYVQNIIFVAVPVLRKILTRSKPKPDRVSQKAPRMADSVGFAGKESWDLSMLHWHVAVRPNRMNAIDGSIMLMDRYDLEKRTAKICLKHTYASIYVMV